MKTLYIMNEYFGGSAKDQVMMACERIKDVCGHDLPVTDSVNVRMDYKTYLEDISDWGHEWEVHWTVNVPDSADFGEIISAIRYNADGTRRTRVKSACLLPNEMWGADLREIWDYEMALLDED